MSSTQIYTESEIPGIGLETHVLTNSTGDSFITILYVAFNDFSLTFDALCRNCYVLSSMSSQQIPG